MPNGTEPESPYRASTTSWRGTCGTRNAATPVRTLRSLARYPPLCGSCPRLPSPCERASARGPAGARTDRPQDIGRA
eukprot:1056970-Pyramimonas_sp.AAC.2